MLELESVCVRHLQNVHLAVGAGECIGLSGASGSGKTLLLRAIADLEPFTGTLCLNAQPHHTFQPWEWRRQVGMLPATSQWWSDRVASHFTEINMDWLQQVGFGKDVMDWPVSRLSSGERQRLAMLRLLANRPQVLLLDEPTANLDSERTAAMERLLSHYRRTAGASVIWVTHDGAQAARVAGKKMTIRGNTLHPETAL